VLPFAVCLNGYDRNLIGQQNGKQKEGRQSKHKTSMGHWGVSGIPLRSKPGAGGPGGALLLCRAEGGGGRERGNRGGGKINR